MYNLIKNESTNYDFDFNLIPPLCLHFIQESYPKLFYKGKNNINFTPNELDKLQILNQYYNYYFSTNKEKLSFLDTFNKNNSFMNSLLFNQDDVLSLLYYLTKTKLGDYKKDMILGDNITLNDLSYKLNTSNYVNGLNTLAFNNGEIASLLKSYKIPISNTQYQIYPMLKEKSSRLYKVSTTLYSTILSNKFNITPTNNMCIIKEDILEPLDNPNCLTVCYYLMLNSLKSKQFSSKLKKYNETKNNFSNNSNFEENVYNNIKSDYVVASKLIRLDLHPTGVHTNNFNMKLQYKTKNPNLNNNEKANPHIHILHPLSELISSKHNLPFAVDIKHLDEYSHKSIIDAVKCAVNIDKNDKPLYENPPNLINPIHPYPVKYLNNHIKKDVINYIEQKVEANKSTDFLEKKPNNNNRKVIIAPDIQPEYIDNFMRTFKETIESSNDDVK